MNFQRKNTKLTLLEDYYSYFNEDNRLKTRHGQVEYTTSIFYIEKYLKENDKIIDIGAGTGAYSIYFFQKGYDVTAVELVQHNIDIMKQKEKNITAIKGNALDLSFFKDNTFDIVLLFGPMYHLLSHDEQLKALKEAKRVTKENGIIFISYYMNEYALIKYGFMEKNILNSIKEERVDKSFHVINKNDDLYTMVRIEDIDSLNQEASLSRIQIIASDGASNYIRPYLNKLTEEEFMKFIEYHLSTCERKDLLGASSHLLDIVRK